jgi:SAM-dependent methyltransferase
MPHRWNQAASIRRLQIESGQDITFNRVFVPYFVGQVKKQKPQSILEVGCGTGHLAAKLSGLSQHVEVLEPSAGMRSVASEVLMHSQVKVHPEEIERFRCSRRFDLVISHLCGQVVADIDAFCSACSALVTERGRFVFSIPHPCFWNDYKTFIPKEAYQYAKDQFASITLTITRDVSHPISGIPFHHRPLGRYIASLNKCRMALTKLDEIFPSKSIQRLYGEPWLFPRYCVLHAIHVGK